MKTLFFETFFVFISLIIFDNAGELQYFQKSKEDPLVIIRKYLENFKISKGFEPKNEGRILM